TTTHSARATPPLHDALPILPSPQPPYEQVRREIVEQVRSGELRPGDRLPAIRAHAADLGLSAGTVARAYKLLEEAQIIVTRRGRSEEHTSELQSRENLVCRL